MRREERLRVLLAMPASTGGIGRHVRMLAAGLLARGHDVTLAGPAGTLASLTADGRWPAEASVGRAESTAAAGGFDALALPLGHGAPAAVAAWRLRAAARRHDVVHAHGVRVGAQAVVATLTEPVPVVATWHNAPLGGPLHRATHAALERVSARGDVVLGASSDLVARARAAGARRVRLCPVVAPAPPAAATPSASAAAAPGAPRGRAGPPQPVILAVARLHPQKRLDLLLDAATVWARRADRPQVLIAGSGPLEAELRARAVELGAPVAFLGERQDVHRLLAQADVVVLPSDWEARPLVAQEALRAGVPLVATDVGGVRDLVGDAALLVPRADAAALAAAVASVLDDPVLSGRLRRDGPSRAATWPGESDMLDLVVETYLEVMSR